MWKKGTDIRLLERICLNHECINNHYVCRYNQDGMCSCTVEIVEETLKAFSKLGILREKRKRYYYVPDFISGVLE